MLLIFSLVIVCSDIFLFTRKKKGRDLVWLSAAGFAAFSTYYILFVRAFLASDFTVEQVFDYSSSSLPWELKLFASWGGSSGSLLLISLFIGILYTGYRFYIRGRVSGQSVAKLLGLLFLYFVVMTLFKGPFQRVSGIPPDGLGLNPQLQSVWMFYHPLVVFAGYAFTALGFALVLARMEGDACHEKLLDLSLKGAWLLFTIGIALGGLWAYQVLGWGGYWAWDPVETASLLPWLALTAYFHGPSRELGADLFPDAMVVLGFDSLLFLSALTRGGLLNSVHAYAFSPAGPALLLCIVASTAYFVYLKARAGKPLIALPERSASTQWKLLLVSQLSLLGVFIVCFVGVIVPTVQNLLVGSADATSFEFYNYISLPFVILFLGASLFCEGGGASARLRLYVLGATGVASSVLLVLGVPSPFAATNVVIPLLVTVAAVTVVSLSASLIRSRSLPLTGRGLIHLGVVVVLMGVFVSSSMSGEAQVVTVATSSTTSINGYTVSVGQPTMGLGSGSAYVPEIDYVVPEQSSMNVKVQITWQGSVFRGTLIEQYFPNYGLVAHPVVLGDGVTDIYVNMVPEQAGYDALFSALIGVDSPPPSVMVQVSSKPLVNLIWWGAALMCMGIAASLPASVWRTRHEKPESA